MSTAKLRRRAAVPAVSARVDVNSDNVSECIAAAGIAHVTSDGVKIGVVFSLSEFERFRTEVEEIELELRSWKSEVERLDGRLIPHERVTAETERLVAGED